MSLRLATAGDSTRLLAIYAPYIQDSCVSFELVVPSPEDFERRIIDTLAALPWIVLEANGIIAGYAYASRYRAREAYRFTVEVSVYLDAAFQGLGHGRQLYSTLFEILKDMNYATALGCLTLPNPASAGLHEAMGFKQVGHFAKVGYKMGSWHDVGWWEKPLQALGSPPAELKSMRDIDFSKYFT